MLCLSSNPQRVCWKSSKLLASNQIKSNYTSDVKFKWEYNVYVQCTHSKVLWMKYENEYYS